MRKLLNFCFEIEFYLKVAFTCTILQQLFYLVLQDFQLNFISQAVLYWLIGSISFYGFGLLIEKVIKKNEPLREKLNARVKEVNKKPYPSFTAKGIITGEIKSFIAVLIILAIAPEAHRGNSLILNFGWFLTRIFLADLCFYLAHWSLHQKIGRKIHLKHHEYADSSSFVAGHKSMAEYIIVTITDLLPIFIFGYDLNQLLAWTIVSNAYNLEGHSSLSIFFISSDFHDLHHTCYQRNYGIQGFWDRIFNTLNTPTKKSGLMFPIASMEKKLYP